MATGNGEAERLPAGMVTFAFTDVEGSTSLLHKLGAEYPAALSRHREIIADALLGAPGVHVLATSRDPLAIEGEMVRRLQPLSLRDASELFADRAAAAGAVHMDPSIIGEIVAQLDGIPLALELAAASTSSLGLREVATKLGDRLGFPQRKRQRGLPHHRTLRALIDWGHDLLTEYERVLFRRLSVFAGGCTLEEAERTCSGELLPRECVAVALSGLVDKSLVQVGPSVTGVSRYTILETLRLYGAERLAAAGEQHDAEMHHLKAMADFANRARDGLNSLEFGDWLRRCDEESSNVSAALAWPFDDNSARSTRLELVCAISTYWSLSGSGVTAVPQWRAVLDESADLDRNAFLMASVGLASRLTGIVEPSEVRRFLAPILEELDVAPPTIALAHVLAIDAWACANENDTELAVTEIERSVRLASSCGEARAIAHSRLYASNIYATIGDTDRSLEEAKLAAEVATAAGLRRMAILADAAVGWAYLVRGDTAASETTTRRALEASIETRSAIGGATARTNLGHVFRLRGELADAARYYSEAIVLAQLGGDRGATAEAIEGLVSLASGAGLVEDAARLLGAADALRTNSFPVEPVLRPALDAARATIDAALDADTVQALGAAGARLTRPELEELVGKTSAALRG